jgi:L-seryl-tRNA(Ser) seleniumtransferase
VDKLTLAALEATLRGPEAPVPEALNSLVSPQRAQRLARRIPGAEIVESVAAVGGGGAPGVELPSLAISLPESFAVRLRTGAIPVVGRVENGRCLLDLRTVRPNQDDDLVAAVIACM